MPEQISNQISNPISNWERLRKFIRENCFLKSDQPIFRLTSGKMSNFYFDLRRATLSPEGQYLIGDIVFDRFSELGLSPRAAGGLTMGADPISTAVAYCSFTKGKPIEAFVIRKEPKTHGTMKQVEGNVDEGDEVVILDDVLTTGKSTIKAIEAAKAAGLKILAAVVLLDRGEHEGKKNVEARGVPLYSIFRMEDFN
ncbi:MAG: orotate phosphoribosyltransferase [Nitrospiraceae bacterium]|nr:orotate phosphoribosyltransferase [Nitrospiraceae bacterium]